MQTRAYGVQEALNARIMIITILVNRFSRFALISAIRPTKIFAFYLDFWKQEIFI